MKYRNIFFTYSLLLPFIISASIALTSCGGGTIGTGIASLGHSAHAAGALSFTASLTVIDSRGNSCPGAKVSITSPAKQFSGKASATGTATLPLTIHSGEMLTVSVRCGTRTYQTTDYLSPAGAPTVTRILKLQPNGSLEIAEP